MKYESLFILNKIQYKLENDKNKTLIFLSTLLIVENI